MKSHFGRLFWRIPPVTWPPVTLAWMVTALASTAFGQLSEVRTIDGTSNNLANPSWGAATVPLLRRAPAAYSDGTNAPADANRPGARLVSNLVVAQSRSIMNGETASDFLWQWGQFIDHDLDLTSTATPNEPFDVPVPAGDPFFDPFATGTKTIGLNRSRCEMVNGVREQVNELTAYLDASMVYGSDAPRALKLRTLDGTGRLKISAGNLLPFNVHGFPNAPTASDPTLFLAGDVRANEQVGLTAIHTLFVREHNHWADYFNAQQPAATDEEIYQLARAIVGAEVQIITYREFLPLLLGTNALAPYAGYQSNVNAGIENVFSTAAFRVGHTLLSPALLRLDSDARPIPAGNLALKDSFFSPGQILTNGGIDPLLRGLAAQPAQEVDDGIVDGVRNFLFGPPGAGGFDLASLNIQRGRDHGLPTYNQTRAAYGLPPKTTFNSISSNTNVQARLAAAYGSVDDIDLWPGGLAEDHLPGAMVGETFHDILKDQFERVRDGDRFWHAIYLPAPLLNLVQTQTLAQIIRRNTSIGSELQDDAFMVPSAPPLLAVEKSGDSVRVSWPGRHTDMTLQMATSLVSTNWTNIVTVGNGAALSASAPAQFFRLIKE
jgi:hypothetical protein